MPRSDHSLTFIIAVLAVTQLVGWGTISLPAVIGEQLARDLSLSLPAVFAGTTVMLVVTGLSSPLMGGAFVKYGARAVMAAGSLIAAPGFVLIAAATRARCSTMRDGSCSASLVLPCCRPRPTFS